MGSRDTPWTKTGKTAREITTTVSGPGYCKQDLVVPAGTGVRFIGGNRWVVGDLAWLRDQVTTASITYHDAVHYGITIDWSLVTDIKDVE